MDTPIRDFLKRYAGENALRLHMPGHKGKSFTGCEALDVTEIPGADSLYDASGIIARSEENASRLFGCRTFYSTEGSSLAIRAMLYLAVLACKGQRPTVIAGRNAHRAFISAAALLDLDVRWISSEGSYLTCNVSACELEEAIASLPEPPAAVYLTSPDYPGNLADIAALSCVCRRYGVLLLVDNAHGAYLRFLPQSLHPIDLGADMCCDSAHKTLPVLTGGAYLHLSHRLSDSICQGAKDALALFGSSSPSYLILASLDNANAYLSTYPTLLSSYLKDTVHPLKKRLRSCGWEVAQGEELKLTLLPRSFGYRGDELASVLLERGIVCEFADPDYLVMMLTPELGKLCRLENTLCSIPRRTDITEAPLRIPACERVTSIRQAMLSPRVAVPVSESEGRILAFPHESCPPAVPIVICGERISAEAVKAFKYYGIESCSVVVE